MKIFEKILKDRSKKIIEEPEREILPSIDEKGFFSDWTSDECFDLLEQGIQPSLEERAAAIKELQKLNAERAADLVARKPEFATAPEKKGLLPGETYASRLQTVRESPLYLKYADHMRTLAYRHFAGHITLKKQIRLSAGVCVKRGTNGLVLYKTALEELETPLKSIYEKRIRLGSELCYIEDVLVTIPPERIRYTK